VTGLTLAVNNLQRPRPPSGPSLQATQVTILRTEKAKEELVDDLGTKGQGCCVRTRATSGGGNNTTKVTNNVDVKQH